MRTVNATLHNHLRTSSYITKNTANKAVRKANKRLGPGGILGVINFNPSPNENDPRWNLFVDNLQYDKVNTGNGVYLPQLDILAVRGQEVPTAENYHVLLIGTQNDQNVKNGTPLEEVLKLGNKFGAFIVEDHPFDRHGIGNYASKHSGIYEQFDAIEVFNGIAKGNVLAREEFNRIKDEFPKLYEFASDDGHSVYEIGRSYSHIEMPSDYEIFRSFPERVVQALKDGFSSNRYKGLGHQEKGSIWGRFDHAIDLSILIGAGKILKWDSNTKTAPLLDKIGIKI
ncbi:MAG: hypothetical protein Q7S27_00045 [Nanoarchaeota archaeon]|nr:hypothetical protein [Nanoarchaeota archaeon]